MLVTERVPVEATTPAPLVALIVPEFVALTSTPLMPAVAPVICPLLALVTVAVVAARMPLPLRPEMVPVLLLTVTKEVFVVIPLRPPEMVPELVPMVTLVWARMPDPTWNPDATVAVP